MDNRETAVHHGNKTHTHDSDLANRIEASLAYYAYNKPHQGLKGATPAEMYYGKLQPHLEAKRPGRAYERRGDSYLFSISYLDPDDTLPLLTSEQAA